MAQPTWPLPPTSSLPALRQPATLTETQISAALDNLCRIYCANTLLLSSEIVHAAAAAASVTKPDRLLELRQTDSGYSSGVNSGYASETEDDAEHEVDLSELRADEFERSFAVRWLQGFIASAEVELAACFESEEGLQLALDRAAELLTSLVCPVREGESGDGEGGEEDGEDDIFWRDFNFPLGEDGAEMVSVRLKDGLAGHRSDDHTDVGLQTWGASIVLCQMMCSSPERFRLTTAALGQSPRIIELGAGTGLVSLMLGKLLPRLCVERPMLVATDYHPTVIQNLVDNIDINFAVTSGKKEDGEVKEVVQAWPLDWADTTRRPDWPLGDDKADMLFATDVIYAPEHAKMLYDCAARLLSPEGVFWLLATVRQNGRFNAVSDTVEAVFGEREGAQAKGEGRVLAILGSERLEKQSSVGRGDETFYKLFRIGWQ
jgi:predicted nicotinamide N-methyase